MGRRVVPSVAVWIALCGSPVAADTPTPTPAPPQANWYANLRPADASSEAANRSWRRIRVRRGGLFALAGVTYMDDALFARVDVGAPVPTTPLPRLRALVALESRYDPSGEQDAKTAVVAVTPQLQHDWRLPFDLEPGELVLALAGGVRRAQTWVRMPEEPFWPSTWESTTLWSYKLDVAVQFRAHGGLLISLQPFGVAVPINDPDPPDERWEPEDPERAIAFSLTAGYQLP